MPPEMIYAIPALGLLAHEGIHFKRTALTEFKGQPLGITGLIIGCNTHF